MNAIDQRVVIVGAGPTGLSLSAELHRLGEPPQILDRLVTCENTSRRTWFVEAFRSCTYGPPSNIPEFQKMFQYFEPV
jgi:cation diffusion facilitator CzcD-associated flavoprotein CzcO